MSSLPEDRLKTQFLSLLDLLEFQQIENVHFNDLIYILCRMVSHYCLIESRIRSYSESDKRVGVGGNHPPPII